MAMHEKKILRFGLALLSRKSDILPKNMAMIPSAVRSLEILAAVPVLSLSAANLSVSDFLSETATCNLFWCCRIADAQLASRDAQSLTVLQSFGTFKTQEETRLTFYSELICLVKRAMIKFPQVQATQQLSRATLQLVC